MNTSRTDLLKLTYNPELAVVVYKSKSSDNDYYLESHDISLDGRMGAGKPLLQETLQAMVDVFFDDKQNSQKIKGLLPENLLHFGLQAGGNYDLIWFRPAEQRIVHFASQLKLDIANCWVPAMLYKATGKTLYVYALSSNARPKENTKLYYAPFYNVWDNGQVCLGNAVVQKPKEKTYESLMKYWEDLFWLSEFSHQNGGEKTRSKLSDVWKRIIKSKGTLKWSEIKELVPSSQTLKSLIR